MSAVLRRLRTPEQDPMVDVLIDQGALEVVSDPLLLALINDEHAKLYLTNAHFHTALDTLVRVMPSMVDALALDALRMAAEMRLQVEALER